MPNFRSVPIDDTRSFLYKKAFASLQCLVPEAANYRPMISRALLTLVEIILSMLTSAHAASILPAR